jgi:hypothetical protein
MHVSLILLKSAPHTSRQKLGLFSILDFNISHLRL